MFRFSTICAGQTEYKTTSSSCYRHQEVQVGKKQGEYYTCTQFIPFVRQYTNLSSLSNPCDYVRFRSTGDDILVVELMT